VHPVDTVAGTGNRDESPGGVGRAYGTGLRVPQRDTGFSGVMKGGRGLKAHEALAGADGSRTGQRTADWAAQRADGLGLRLHLVRVAPEPSYYRVPAEYAKAVAGAEVLLGLERDRVAERHPTLALESDDSPADVLIRAAEKASLLVIGCWGRGGLRKPIGSIAEKVLMRLPCPTIITRPAPRPASDSGTQLQLP
jgi:nucleotide-binding universal stress UspA family protein